MWRTEVSIGALTWVFYTERVRAGSAPVADFETTITEPNGQITKPVRHCVTEKQAREVHEALVADYAARTGAVVVECAPRPPEQP